jgi:hypothetical protein
MTYFANFQMHNDHQFRFDTRIYLRDADGPSNQDYCAAAIIGKNPGSAKPICFDRLAKLSLDGDKLLPFVRNRFVAAYAMSGKPIPPGTFIRVWNLLYICNPKLTAAIQSIQTLRLPPICESEHKVPPIVWFAWGPPHTKLAGFCKRFTERTMKMPFYYDSEAKRIVSEKPSLVSKAKHTQGLSSGPIELHLARMLSSH